MDALIAFVVASIVSFFGSLQLGIVNVTVIDTALNRDRKHALWLAIGGVLPEIPYTFIALYATDSVEILEKYKTQLGLIVGAILLLLGLSYFFRKPKNKKQKKQKRKPLKAGSFLKGFLLAAANPQLILFWSGILILLQTGSLNIGEPAVPLIDFSVNSFISPQWSFALGAAFGAFAILYIYIVLSGKYRTRLLSLLGDKLGKIVGVVFIVLGLVAIIRNVV